MAEPIEDVSSLPGEPLLDQDDGRIGTIERVYEGDDGEGAMWVSVEASLGIGSKRTVYVPLARLKKENDSIKVPYSTSHIRQCPEIESTDQISAEDDVLLRDHYGIDRADHEIRTDNESYADQVPQKRGSASTASD
jgi:PRC-barrel domain